MYIPGWLIIIVIVYLVFVYLRNKWNDSETNNHDDDSMTVEQMWEMAAQYQKWVMAKSPNLEKFLDDEREMIQAMEKDALRLRERFKHDPLKQKEIAKDWKNFAEAVNEVKSAREMLDVDMEDNAFDRFNESTKEPFVTIQEITKRVIGILGEDSAMKTVYEKQIKKSQTISEILEEKTGN